MLGKIVRCWLLGVASLFFLTTCAYAGEIGGDDGEGEKKPEYQNSPWSWTDKELSKISSLEKKLKQDDSGYWVREDKAYIVKSNISKRFTAELCLYMDYFIEIFPKVFPTPPAGKMLTKLNVVVYKDRMEYARETQSPAWSGGVHWFDDWSHGWPTLYVATFPWKMEEGKEPNFCENFNRGTLQHEGTHAMFRKFSGKALLPVFVNEGCATFLETWDMRVLNYSSAEVEKRRLRGFHMESIVRKFDEDKNFKPSLKQCMDYDHYTWGSGEIALHYGLAESFADYMLSDKKRRKLFKKMIERIYKRRMDKVDVLTSDEVKDLEPGWHEHLADLAAKIRPLMKQREEERFKESGSDDGVAGTTVDDATAAGTSVSSGVTGYGSKVNISLSGGKKISAEEFKACKSPQDLIKLIQKKMSE